MTDKIAEIRKALEAHQNGCESLPDLLDEVGALRAALDAAEARAQEARALALQEAAKSLADRAEGERQASIYFKEKARDYKAREAAHVARLMDQHVPHILARIDTPAAEALAERDKRVREDEREACAKVAEQWNDYTNPEKSGLVRDCGIRNGLANDIVAAIRARGER